MSTIMDGPHTYVNPPSIGWQVDVAALTTLIPALICVAARTYTKTCLIHSFGWEDCFSFGALAVAIGRTVLQILGTHRYIYVIVMMLAKSALLLFLYRIFKFDTKFRYMTWALGTIIVLWSIISVLLLMFSCRPTTAPRNLAQRLDPKTVFYPESYIVINYYDFCNSITDFALIPMPVPLLQHFWMGA